jgi:hypothetical protein
MTEKENERNEIRNKTKEETQKNKNDLSRQKS